jgi:putative spermidine/putrescine transport system ATP-binding protein
MQIELKLLHERLGLTVVYVTHDQGEALTMSDRVAVFHDGAVVQQDTPDALYSRPQDPFVAGFIGENNMVEATARRVEGGLTRVELPGGVQLLATAVGAIGADAPVILAIRPEAISVADGGGPAAENTCRARVKGRIYLGDHQRLLAEIDNGPTLTVKVAAATGIGAGDTVALNWAAADCMAFLAAGLTQDVLNREWTNQ